MADEKGPSERMIVMDGKIYTRNPGKAGSVYGEKMIEHDGSLYREWIPWRSKLGALIRKKGGLPFQFSGNILYLGAAQGTTVSHISDLIGKFGIVYAVEFARAPYAKLRALAERRVNIVPILEDAFHPERYRAMVPACDILYQDVAQKRQVELFVMSSRIFLRPGGKGILMLKSRSVDVTARPGDIYETAVAELKKIGFLIRNTVELGPYQSDHAALIVEKSG